MVGGVLKAYGQNFGDSLKILKRSLRNLLYMIGNLGRMLGKLWYYWENSKRLGIHKPW